MSESTIHAPLCDSPQEKPRMKLVTHRVRCSPFMCFSCLELRPSPREEDQRAGVSIDTATLRALRHAGDFTL